jgi:hypothetical protein
MPILILVLIANGKKHSVLYELLLLSTPPQQIIIGKAVQQTPSIKQSLGALPFKLQTTFTQSLHQWFVALLLHAKIL